MASTLIDKAKFKESLKDLLLEDPNLLKTILMEIRDESEERKKKLDDIIDLHFKEYDEVFRALA
jgi:hypothetical protein